MTRRKKNGVTPNRTDTKIESNQGRGGVRLLYAKDGRVVGFGRVEAEGRFSCGGSSVPNEEHGVGVWICTPCPLLQSH